MNEVLIALLVILLIALAGLRRMPAQRVATVRRFGRLRRTIGPGWHWLVPGLDRSGAGVDMIGHHLRVDVPDTAQAELHFQIVEPDKAGEALERVDAFVADQAREAIVQVGREPEQLKREINRRVGRHGLRVIRCSLHLG